MKIFKYQLKSKYIPFIIFFTLVIVKSILTLNAAGPMVFGDELLYKEFSLNLFENLQYNNVIYELNGNIDKVIYPPLYPLSLVPSLFFQQDFNDFYAMMLFLNILYSSAIIFAVWLISRLFLNAQKSTYCCIISALIPFHIIFPRSIMSENLFFPLFLFVIFTIIYRPKKHLYLWSILTGFLLSTMLLTRYLSLVTIPIFMIVWWLKPVNRKFKDNSLFSKFKLLNFIIILVSAFFVYLPWIYMNLKNNNNFLEFTGVVITGIGNTMGQSGHTSSLLLSDLFMWTIFFMSFVIILLAPLLTILILGFQIKYKKKISDNFNRYILLILGLTSFLLFAVIRHSWRTKWNYPIPGFINGRYITFILVPFIILAFIIWDKIEADWKDKNSKDPKGITIIFSGILSIFLILGAYYVLIKQSIWKTSPWFLMPHTAHDAFIYSLIGIKYLLFVLVIIIIINLLIWKKTIYAKYLFFIFLIIFYVWGNVIIYPYITSMQNNSKHGRLFADVLDHNDAFTTKDTIDIFYNIEIDNYYFTNHLWFWGIDKDRLNIKKINETNNNDTSILENSNGYFITKDLFIGIKLASYYVNDRPYRIYRLPLPNQQNISSELITKDIIFT